MDSGLLGPEGGPVQQRGVTPTPGLYFLGLSWMHTRGSALIGWVGRDADYIAGVIRSRVTQAQAAYEPALSEGS
jgi:putative flavoprotein involved in K+ transport